MQPIYDNPLGFYIQIVFAKLRALNNVTTHLQPRMHSFKKQTIMKKILFIVLFISSSIISAQNDGWHISTNENSDYTGIAIANGRIGMLSYSKPLQIQQKIISPIGSKQWI